MADVNVRVSGSIIEELSSKIPSNIFALNEIIKNSYDAFSSKVYIKIDLTENQLVIDDDGIGMNADDIRSLFHIAKSSKKYGQKVTINFPYEHKLNGRERIVQGSKGLGFLSAFKFGQLVEWRTCRSGVESTFSVPLSDLIKMDNLSDYVVNVSERKTDRVGTKIIIHSNKEVLLSLVEYLKNEKNALKLVGAFLDPSIDIEIKLPNRDGIDSKSITELKDINPTDRFLYVEMNREDREIRFYHRGNLYSTKKLEISSELYDIEAKIVIYSLPAHGKKKISKYYYRESDEALTPLLFINDSFFNNYNVFDSNIFRQKRSEQSLSQMIGFVNVRSSSSGIDFNSDRTNFVENGITDLIKKDVCKYSPEQY